MNKTEPAVDHHTQLLNSPCCTYTAFKKILKPLYNLDRQGLFLPSARNKTSMNNNNNLSNNNNKQNLS